jgi:hypothetical protein
VCVCVCVWRGGIQNAHAHTDRAAQVASVGERAERLQIAAPLLAGGKPRAAYLELVQRTPARHTAVSAHTGPDNRRLLVFSAGSTLTVYEKRKDGWWGGTFDGATGWFPSHLVNPVEVDQAMDRAVDKGGTVSFLEPSATDPLYLIPGWYVWALRADRFGGVACWSVKADPLRPLACVGGNRLPTRTR